MKKLDKQLTDKDGEVAELSDEFFAKAKRGRPELPTGQKKQRVTIMIDPDLIAHFKKEGKGWQTRANNAMRKGAGL